MSERLSCASYFLYLQLVGYFFLFGSFIYVKGWGNLLLFCYCCLVAKLCPTLCYPMDCSLPGSSVHGISQTRILEWLAISISKGFSGPRGQTPISCLSGRFFTTEPPRKSYLNSCLKKKIPVTF